MTFSVVIRDPATGEFGVGVSSSSPAVGARCAFARAGVGAVTSQNITDPRLGPKILDLMEAGLDAEGAIEEVTVTLPYRDYRQLTAVDRNGNTAIWSGPEALGTFSEAKTKNVASAGNLLSNEYVPHLIVESVVVNQWGTKSIAEQVLEALEAGLEAGGEAGPVHSAAMIIVDREAWPLVDLRVDWTEHRAGPIAHLRQLWNLYKPQMADYVTRALNPMAAPSYGVPGNE